VENLWRALLLSLLLVTKVSGAELCKFEYWQVIPAETRCDVYSLPDFRIRAIPTDLKDPPHIQRFCTNYEIESKYKTERSGYCFTGEGRPSGPVFNVGTQTFVASFNFQGCRGSEAVSGIVFHPAFGTPAAKKAPLIPVEPVFRNGERVSDCRVINGEEGETLQDNSAFTHQFKKFGNSAN
jgi:hypothetical protein